MKAIVLAAGVGSRLDPFTRYLAKPMVTVVNRPVMEHILRSIAAMGIGHVLSNLYYRPDDITSHFEDGSAFGMQITWHQEAELTGPAGAVLRFVDVLGDSEELLVVSGDAFHDVDLREFVAYHKQRNALLSVVLRRVQDPGRFGVAVLDREQRIVQFTEKPLIGAGVDGLVSCGIYCVSRRCLSLIPAGKFYDFGQHLIPALAAARDRVYGFVTDAYWQDIGTTSAVHGANIDAVSGRVRIEMPGKEVEPGIWLEEGVHIADDARLKGPIVAGKGVRIGPRAEIVGPTVLGHAVHLGADAYVANSVLLAGARVADSQILANALVGALPPASADGHG